MKKKSFLIPVSVLAVTLSTNAMATLPESVSSQLSVQTISLQQQVEQVKTPFILERVKAGEKTLFVAAHRSHASHASHASHVSSRY